MLTEVVLEVVLRLLFFAIFFTPYVITDYSIRQTPGRSGDCFVMALLRLRASPSAQDDAPLLTMTNQFCNRAKTTMRCLSTR